MATEPIFAIPKSEQDTDALIEQAKQHLSSLEDDELWQACKELIGLAGSFNHCITRKHRDQILDLLVGVGYDAIDPVLDDLVACPRLEQFDITKAFICRLVDEAREH